ncbi:MAG: YjbQ family protein [Chitinophagales bacterium]|nr:YjbQ family protein [Chitinophagales bacterium]
MIIQKEIILPRYARGFHLITHHIINALDDLPEVGLLHVFIKHTSAGLTINENADSDVLHDMNAWMDKYVKENEAFYKHTIEGSDDMPAHIKSSLVGSFLMIPISNHQLNLGTWQGIYLGEFRNNGGNRKLVISVYTN